MNKLSIIIIFFSVALNAMEPVAKRQKTGVMANAVTSTQTNRQSNQSKVKSLMELTSTSMLNFFIRCIDENKFAEFKDNFKSLVDYTISKQTNILEKKIISQWLLKIINHANQTNKQTFAISIVTNIGTIFEKDNSFGQEVFKEYLANEHKKASVNGITEVMESLEKCWEIPETDEKSLCEAKLFQEMARYYVNDPKKYEQLALVARELNLHPFEVVANKCDDHVIDDTDFRIQGALRGFNAANSNNYAFFKALIENAQLLGTLGHTFEPNRGDNNGRTLLHYIAHNENRDLELIKYLIERGINPCIKDVYNVTARDIIKTNWPPSTSSSAIDYLAKAEEKWINEHSQ